MNKFARQIIGYHGCLESFGSKILSGETSISDWEPSTNNYDWLGHGIYFWEHSPHRALRWAQETCDRKNTKDPSLDAKPLVIGVILQLGRCLDLLDENFTRALSESYYEMEVAYLNAGWPLPTNTGWNGKKREWDSLVINDYLSRLEELGEPTYDTVRGAFEEGNEAYPGAGFKLETHIQIAVRNTSCILGVFLPNLNES